MSRKSRNSAGNERTGEKKAAKSNLAIVSSPSEPDAIGSAAVTAQNPFDTLLGRELKSVSFVLDYVEFCFHEPIVRALTHPVAVTLAGRISFPSAGSRDALCSFIGQEVVSTRFREDEWLEICFEDDETISIPMTRASRIGRDAIHWIPGLHEPFRTW